MATYYRFQNEQPQSGEVVHCWKSLEDLKKFASMMRMQDPDFHMMKFWQVEGVFVRNDEDDVEVRVSYAKQIYLK